MENLLKGIMVAVSISTLILCVLIYIKVAKKKESYKSKNNVKMTPVVSGTGGVYKNGSAQDCMNQDWSWMNSTDPTAEASYYCDGKMIDTFSNEYCPPGSAMALTQNQCNAPLVAGDGNSNAYLCCKDSSKCNFPADTSCVIAGQKRKCQDAPPSWGLPSEIGMCA